MKIFYEYWECLYFSKIRGDCIYLNIATNTAIIMLTAEINSADQAAFLALLAISFASLAIVISSSLPTFFRCSLFFSSHSSARRAFGYIGSLELPYMPSAKSVLTFDSPSFSNLSSNNFLNLKSYILNYYTLSPPKTRARRPALGVAAVPETDKGSPPHVSLLQAKTV